MSRINVGELAGSMLAAAEKPLEKQWGVARDYAAAEFQKIATAIGLIDDQLASGEMTEDEAKLHLDVQKNASRAVMLTLEGLGILAVEAAINAAMDAIKVAVNGALGFALI